jgi:hypothetical protein
MFQWTMSVRLLAYVRRGVRALEKLADAQAELTRLRVEAWNRRNAQRVVRPESFTIGTLDVAEANKVYHQMRVDRGEEDE